MAKIRNSNPKQSGGGYERLVGNKKMAQLFTKAQSTVITNGTELEKIICSLSEIISNLDKFIDECDNGTIKDGTYLCPKKVVKASKYRLAGHEPDFLSFTINKSKNLCYIVELKDGDAFDTKKSVAEKEMLQLFLNHLAPKIPFRSKYYICCFNQDDKEKIVSGLKNVFSIDEVLTGREFCNILGIDFDFIIEYRKEDTEDNFNYVAAEMSNIKEVCNAVMRKQRSHIQEENFYIEGEEDKYDNI